jgi:hypothetical protein
VQVPFSFILVATRFFVRSAFVLVCIPIFTPSLFFLFLFDGFTSTQLQHLTIVPLDLNKYSNVLVEIGKIEIALILRPFVVGSLSFYFLNSFTKSELFTY